MVPLTRPFGPPSPVGRGMKSETASPTRTNSHPNVFADQKNNISRGAQPVAFPNCASQSCFTTGAPCKVPSKQRQSTNGFGDRFPFVASRHQTRITHDSMPDHGLKRLGVWSDVL